MLFSKVFKQKTDDRRADVYRALLHHEAKVGGELFGPIPKNHRREFFCLDEYTWVWHEEWIDEGGDRQIMMTRYDVRPNSILKSQGGQSYQKLTYIELQNFYQAVSMYGEKICGEYRQMLQTV